MAAIDNHTDEHPAAQAIWELFTTVKIIADREGEWGSDVLQALGNWFIGLGFDVDAGPDNQPNVPREIRP